MGADVSGAFVSGGHNLIGVLGDAATGFVPSDLRGTAATPLDPLLLPLHHNGGPTRTHALAKGSPAINAGDNTDAPPTDQRGRQRIVGGTIDIGSYEVQAKHDHDDDRDDDDDHDHGRDDFWKNYAPAIGNEDDWLAILAGNAGRKRGYRRE